MRTLISNLPGVVFRCRADADFTKEFVSDGCFNLTGYPAERLIGESSVTVWRSLLHPDDADRVLAELREMVARQPPIDGQQFRVNYRIVTREGQTKHVRDRFRLVHDADGGIVALEGFINDVTERTLAEQMVRESEYRYRLLAENMRDLVCLHALDGKWLYVSPSSAAMLGYAPDELVGTSPADLIHPEDLERICGEAYAPLRDGKLGGLVVESRLHDKKGDFYWFETMAQAVSAPDGTVIQLQTASRDITNRKAAEAEREKTQEELARLLMREQEASRDADAARVEAEHANRAKDEFLQMVSHEFRTPLTTIKTLVRVLQRDGETKAERDRHLETIAAGKAETLGVGLGLYLAKRLITALDGLISVSSEVGRGSCFTIFLPIWNEKTHGKDTLDEYDFDEKDTEETTVGG